MNKEFELPFIKIKVERTKIKVGHLEDFLGIQTLSAVETMNQDMT